MPPVVAKQILKESRRRGRDGDALVEVVRRRIRNIDRDRLLRLAWGGDDDAVVAPQLVTAFVERQVGQFKRFGRLNLNGAARENVERRLFRVAGNFVVGRAREFGSVAVDR